MKSTLYTRIAFLLIFLIAHRLDAQDNRLAKTKVADLLALLPTTDNGQATRLFNELINLGDDALVMVTHGVKPNGDASGVPSRYGVSLLTHYSTRADQKTRIEKVYLSALASAGSTEVKAYFMDNLKLIGSNASVQPLSMYIANKELFDQAISTLVAIGTPAASKALMQALGNTDPEIQARLVKSMGTLRYAPALPAISKDASSENMILSRHALWSMALIADAGSYDELVKHAKAVGFKNDPTEATTALVEYMHQMSAKGNKNSAKDISQLILANTPDATQQHFRLAGLGALSAAEPASTVKLLIKELSRFDAEYRKEVLKIAVTTANAPRGTETLAKDI